MKYLDMRSKMLILKYEETREAVDIDAAVDFCENAYNNAPKGDLRVDEDTRGIFSLNLCRALMLKYGDVTRDPADLERAITISEQTLHRVQDTVIRADVEYLLSRLILHKYELTESSDDLCYAALHSVQAFNWIPEDHPRRQEYLKNLVMIETVESEGRENLFKIIPQMENRSL